VKSASVPQAAATLPLGAIEPPVPAEASIVKLFRLNVAAIVWSPVTFVNV
jgi:hypothetical protein